MPQQMNVLCCYKCNMYQVHIVKKSNKWQCKICGEKQSIQVVYFQGSGSDCRKEVQHLNYLKKADQQSFHSTSIDAYGLDCVANDNDDIDRCNCSTRCKRSAGKWAKYLDIEEDDSSSDSTNDNENFSSQVDTKNPRKQIKKIKQSFSLPTSPNSTKMKFDSEEMSYETRAGNSRSRTYPLVDSSLKIISKWDKYLEGEKEASSSKTKISQIINTTDDSDSSCSCTKNIFNDLNDDLDFSVDF